MGLRLHKFLGYGLTDVVAEGYQITDPRINTGSWVLDYSAPPAADYLAWLNEHRCDRFGYLDTWYLREGDPEADLCRSFAYSPEYGLPNVLVLRPVSQPEWSRADDPVDYAQEVLLAGHLGETANRADPIITGLYPWSGTYMDARTGANLPHDVIQWVRLRNTTRDSTGRRLGLETLARHFGYADQAEAQANIVPAVPPEIRDLAAYAELFTDDTIWRQLRPLLYTYWT